MKRFLRYTVFFIVPVCILGFLLEIYSRDNTYKVKAAYISQNKDSIELLVLGSSHNWRAINPEYFDLKTAQLAHGGSAFNIDYLLFEKFFPEFPRLKIVIFEMSYHTLERYWPSDWNQNHLFYLYYGINNYEKDIPLTEHLLITANPSGYLKKVYASLFTSRFEQYNQYGFIPSYSSLVKHHYDTTKLYSTPSLRRRHHETNLEAYKKNTEFLDKMVRECLSRNIKVVLLSPPNFYLYNRHMKPEKLERRNDIFEKYKAYKNVYVWNYETSYEYKSALFNDPDHLNAAGATAFSSTLNTELNKLLATEPRNLK